MIELLNMDCMDYMRTLDVNAFDLAIVDPPYGIDITRQQLGNRKAKPLYRGKGDWDNAAPPPEYFTELRRVSRNQIVWGINHMCDRFDAHSEKYVVWDKCNDGMSFADVEIAYTSFTGAARMYRQRWNGSQARERHEADRIHPTQKPVALYEWLLDMFAKPGDRILDTHLGSGSSAMACHRMGFDMVGLEIDATHHANAQKRLNATAAQLTIPVGLGKNQ